MGRVINNREPRRSQLKRSLTLAAILLFSIHSPTLSKGTLQHEKLRFRNTFKTPQEVIRYYCLRDASGFVWSGLLDVERRAFTTWKSPPQHDSFYIARSFEILPGAKINKNRAEVEVRYVIKGIGDAHGTFVPAKSSDRYVKFNLIQKKGRWKIAEPRPPEIAPVVLEERFPFEAKNVTTAGLF